MSERILVKPKVIQYKRNLSNLVGLTDLRLREIDLNKKSESVSNMSRDCLGNHQTIDEDMFRSNKVKNIFEQIGKISTSQNIMDTSVFRNQMDDFKTISSNTIAMKQMTTLTSEVTDVCISKESQHVKSKSETILILHKQLKHLQKMNEFFQISLTQKDKIYKTMVEENIRLKNQINILEQQLHAKIIQQSDSNLFQKSPLKILTADKNSKIENEQTNKIERFKLEQSKSELMKRRELKRNTEQKEIVFKPHRLNGGNYDISNFKRQDLLSKRTLIEDQGNIFSSSNLNNSIHHSEKEYNNQSPKISQFYRKDISKDGKLPLKIRPTILQSSTDSHQSKWLEKIIQKPSDDVHSYQSLFNNDTPKNEIITPLKTPSNQLLEEVISPQNQFQKMEIKSLFVSHSTDFAFVTKLFDLNSSNSNLKFFLNTSFTIKYYQDNKRVCRKIDSFISYLNIK